MVVVKYSIGRFTALAIFSNCFLGILLALSFSILNNVVFFISHFLEASSSVRLASSLNFLTFLPYVIIFTSCLLKYQFFRFLSILFFFIGGFSVNFSSKHWKLLSECFKANISNNSKYFCLFLLHSGGSGSFYLGEIAALLQCSQRSAGKCVAQLTKHGFIKRQLVSHDRSRYELVDYQA